MVLWSHETLKLRIKKKKKHAHNKQTNKLTNQKATNLS